MVVVRPFKGLRPRKDVAEEVASPPYDVLDSDEARDIVKKNPNSFLRVVKPEVDLPPSVDLYSEDVYRQGANNLKELIQKGIMVQDERPVYYFYRQVMGEHSQVGLVATVSARDYENDKIKKHEHTREVKEKDRVKHIETQEAQSGPVFLTYHDVRGLNSIQARIGKEKAPEVDFTSEDGIRHTLWLVEDRETVEEIRGLFQKVPHLYVADGHHRSAAGAIVARKKRKANPHHTGDEEYNYFLAVLFPKSHMKILAYNRAVKDLNGRDKDEFLQEIGKSFTISEGNVSKRPERAHSFSMYLDGRWYELEPKQGTYPEEHPVKSIDASILQKNLLDPVLGIKNPRKSERIKFVGGIRGTDELERLVDSGKFEVAFSLYPTSVDQLIDVADSGKVMPPKSTWFEPKLRSGLVIHLI